MSKITSVQKKLWEECRRIHNVKNATDCYICGSSLIEAKSKHLGHLIPKKFLPTQMKYDLRILKPCCYNCNMNLGGNAFLFGVYLEKEYGKEFLEEIVYDFQFYKYIEEPLTEKQKLEFYTKQLEEYKQL